MSLKTKQEEKKPWISPIEFLKPPCVLKGRLADPRTGRLCPLKGVRILAKVSPSADQRRPAHYLCVAERWAIQPRPGNESRLLLPDCQLTTSSWLSAPRHILAPFRARLCSAEKDLLWKWEGKCPHTTGASFFFRLFFTACKSNILGIFILITPMNILAWAFSLLWPNLAFLMQHVP